MFNIEGAGMFSYSGHWDGLELEEGGYKRRAVLKWTGKWLASPYGLATQGILKGRDPSLAACCWDLKL